MKLKVLLVDDEYPARQELRFILSQFPDVEVVGEAASADEAMHLLERLDYAAVFLDIQMPGESGLVLSAALARLPRPPLVVFVTAYDEYAVQAFEVNAADYLLKPLEEVRVRKAIDRIKERLLREESVSPPPEAEGEKRISRLPVELSGRTFLIDIANIAFAYSENETVSIRSGKENYLSRLTLNALEQRLNTPEFFRVHRCFIVNLKKVKEIIPYFNGAYSLAMETEGQSEVPVSRNRVRQLRSLLGF